MLVKGATGHAELVYSFSLGFFSDSKPFKMTSNDTLPSKDIVDLDQVLHSWASQRFGGDYVVEKIDSSKLNVQQKAVVYKGGGDWWKQQTVYEEYNDNDDKDPFTWHFSHCIKVMIHCAVRWNLHKTTAKLCGRSTQVIVKCMKSVMIMMTKTRSRGTSAIVSR